MRMMIILIKPMINMEMKKKLIRPHRVNKLNPVILIQNQFWGFQNKLNIKNKRKQKNNLNFKS